MLALNCLMFSELWDVLYLQFKSVCLFFFPASFNGCKPENREKREKREKRLQKSGPLICTPECSFPGCLQGITAAVLYLSTQGNFTALQGTLLSLTSLLLASLAPSCTWTFFMSMPDHSSVTSYHCQEATSNIFPAQWKGQGQLWNCCLETAFGISDIFLPYQDTLFFEKYSFFHMTPKEG